MKVRTVSDGGASLLNMMNATGGNAAEWMFCVL